MRRGFALAWTALTALIAGTAAYFSYQAGWSAGIGTKIPEGATAIAPYYYGPHWDFGFFGFFWFLLFLFLIFGLLRGFARMGRGYGGGRWQRGPMEDRLREWHRQAHDQPAEPEKS